MIEDIIKSVKASLYERSTSPLFGALAISWILWNYRVWLVVFSGMPALDKIGYLQEAMYTDPWEKAIFLAIGPVITAALFLFVYPYPAKWVFRFWRRKQKELRDIRTEIEGDTLLSLEESRRIRGQLIEIQKEYDEQLRKASQDLERTKQQLVERQGAVETLEGQLNEAKTAVSGRLSSAHSLSDAELSQILRASPFRLFHNPERGASKIMMFGPSERILEGANNNEHTWQLVNGKLELVQADGKVHSRFDYHPTSKVFTHTNDSDTLSKRGQFLIPEPKAAQQSVAAGVAKQPT